ncbi:MAG: helix-turn-helix domain-containing protein [Candidatus Riflebacteria bacterium]|nr:helix-turn-helix domain-containing protein [Candidatus Riflebacteria bacterium]
MNKIKQVLLKKNISQSELARTLGIKPAALNQMIHGNPTQKTLEKIASALEVPVSSLIDNDPDVPEGWVKVKIIGTVPAGVAIEAVEDFIDEVPVPGYEYKADKTMGFKVYGDSMEPELRDGDYVIVRTDLEPHNGDIVVCRVNCYGEVTLKRFYKKERTIVLQPDNPKYEPIIIPISSGVCEPNDIHIVGVFTMLVRKRVKRDI